jgi:predicted outer membrane repeat protein
VINAAIVDVSDSEFTSNLANDGYGGALFASDQLVVKGSEFTENVASKRGGAIAVSTSRAKILDSTFDGNSADDYGGAIATVWELNAGHIGDLAISRSTFNNNAALLGDGGAVSFRGNGFAGDISISESTFKNSYAGEEGGALYLYDARYAKVSGSTFGNPADNDDANEAGDRGGDIASNIGGGVNYVTRMDVLNSWFEAAYAHDAGGSMWLNCVRMRMSGVTVSDATSDGEGAGVIFGADGCLPEYEVVIKDSDFLENVTDDQGGAIANIQGAGANALKAIRISNVTFAENEADSGAAINIDGQRLVSITGSTFFENQTASGGGAIELCNTDLAVTSSTFERNDAGAEGGAILANCGTGNKISIVSSLFKENHTDANYGAASFGVYDTRLIGNDFINNTATLSGGAVGITVNTGDSDLYTFGRWKNNSFSGNSADVDGQHIVAFYDVGSLAPSTTDELLRLLTRGRGSVLFPGADWMVQY